MKIVVRKIGSRWQPVDSSGNVVRGDVYNADGSGYSTKEGAAEAAEMLRTSRTWTPHVPQRAHAAIKRGGKSGGKSGTWAVEAGRGLTYDRGDGRGPLLMFNLHRHVHPGTGGSYINPVDLDEIAHEIASFLNRKKRKLKVSHTDPGA